jgi:hypothetical protein
MKFASTPVRSLLMVVAFLASASRGYPQGTLQWTVTFDGWPPLEPWWIVNIDYYGEEYMTFTPIGPDDTLSPHISQVLDGAPVCDRLYGLPSLKAGHRPALHTVANSSGV